MVHYMVHYRSTLELQASSPTRRLPSSTFSSLSTSRPGRSPPRGSSRQRRSSPLSDLYTHVNAMHMHVYSCTCACACTCILIGAARHLVLTTYYLLPAAYYLHLMYQAQLATTPMILAFLNGMVGLVRDGLTCVMHDGMHYVMS